MQIQRQLHSGMNSSSTRQQIYGYSGRRNCQRYVVFDQIDNRINFITNVLPVTPDSSKKNISPINNYDGGPLHFAALAGCSQIVECLLKYGAYVKSKDKDGRTAFHNDIYSGADFNIRTN
ncbi:uncharacterized protein LOC136032353 [Artemia franciscana]|uniref:uncharacterized protein LOC136032353 n=1 Tax=Artemia franciscana TaxID=6661 RepID=UPI0032DBA122